MAPNNFSVKWDTLNSYWLKNGAYLPVTVTESWNEAAQSKLAEMRNDPFYRLTENVEDASEEETEEVLDIISKLSADDLAVSSSEVIAVWAAIHVYDRSKVCQKADKFFKQHEDVRKAFVEDIRKFIRRDHPESVDVKRLKGIIIEGVNCYRIRIGDYRVIYTVTNGKIVVVCALLAGSRGDVYKGISGLK